MCLGQNNTAVARRALTCVVQSDGQLVRRRKRNSEPTKSLIVRGLEDGVEEKSLYEWFANHSKNIKGVRIIRDKLSGVSRGFGFVDFHSVDDAEAVVEATGGAITTEDGDQLWFDFSRGGHGAEKPGGDAGICQIYSGVRARINQFCY